MFEEYTANAVARIRAHALSQRRGRTAEFAEGGNPAPFTQQTVKGQTQDTVHLGNVTDLHSDEELANHAGFSDRHHGYDVKRHKDDNGATVNLWKS